MCAAHLSPQPEPEAPTGRLGQLPRRRRRDHRAAGEGDRDAGQHVDVGRHGQRPTGEIGRASRLGHDEPREPGFGRPASDRAGLAERLSRQHGVELQRHRSVLTFPGSSSARCCARTALMRWVPRGWSAGVRRDGARREGSRDWRSGHPRRCLPVRPTGAGSDPRPASSRRRSGWRRAPEGPYPWCSAAPSGTSARGTRPRQPGLDLEVVAPEVLHHHRGEAVTVMTGATLRAPPGWAPPFRGRSVRRARGSGRGRSSSRGTAPRRACEPGRP